MIQIRNVRYASDTGEVSDRELNPSPYSPLSALVNLSEMVNSFINDALLRSFSSVQFYRMLSWRLI